MFFWKVDDNKLVDALCQPCVLLLTNNFKITILGFSFYLQHV